jgi:hypothetical protein
MTLRQALPRTSSTRLDWLGKKAMFLGGVEANEGYICSVYGGDARYVFEWLTGHAWVSDGVASDEMMRAMDGRGGVVGGRRLSASSSRPGPPPVSFFRFCAMCYF